MTAVHPLRSGPPTHADGGTALLRWLGDMRSGGGPWRDERGIHHVFGYDDTLRVLSDPGTFSSDRTRLAPAADGGVGGAGLTMLDPPEHGKLRRLIAEAFTPRTVKAMEPRIAAIADDLLDALPGDGFDVVADLAHPLPVIVVAEMLGVPLADREMFRSWADGLMSMQVDDLSNAELFGAVAAAMRDMGEYMLRACRERRAAPRDDLISRLAYAEVDGERLDDHQVADVCGLLLLAGHITSTILLGNAVLCLDAQPGLAERLRADRAAVPAAIEEVMRLRSPFLQVGRVTTREATLSTGPVPAGSFVMAWLLSANHDERRFPDPERFDLDRAGPRHVAFGHGVHHCIGAALARAEVRVVLERLVTRYGRLRPVAEGVSYYEGAVLGPRCLPVVVEGAGSRG